MLVGGFGDDCGELCVYGVLVFCLGLCWVLILGFVFCFGDVLFLFVLFLMMFDGVVVLFVFDCVDC